jgi:hypothetical protein
VSSAPESQFAGTLGDANGDVQVKVTLITFSNHRWIEGSGFMGVLFDIRKMRIPAEADQHSCLIAITIPGDCDQCSWGRRSALLREADQ